MLNTAKPKPQSEQDTLNYEQGLVGNENLKSIKT